MAADTEYYQITAEEALRKLVVSKRGLPESDARNRLDKFGLNKIAKKKKVSAAVIFFSQFKSVLLGLLIFATVISAALGFLLDAAVIVSIVVLNAVLGFVQEYKASKAAEALEKLAVLKATVVRDGKARVISAEELVPGDIVLLNAGDKVPADCRLLELANLKVDESLLTGESVPVEKFLDAIKKSAPLAERKNCVFANTIVTYGKCTAVVFSTGASTEVGKIASLIQEVKQKETPLQKKLSQLALYIGIAVAVIAALVFGVGLLQGQKVFELLLTSISLAVAAVPEGLPAIITITLALGMSRMAKAKAIVRQLPAVETLGNCSFICTDKTGTLTKNEMTVKEIFADDTVVEVTGEGYEPEGNFLLEGKRIDAKKVRELELMLRIGALCNNAVLEKYDSGWEIVGDPTEGALIVLAAKAGLQKDELLKMHPQVAELSFDASRKRMSTIHKFGGEHFVFTKGAADMLLDRCSKVLEKGKVRKLTDKQKANILKQNGAMASKALRVLGLAYKPLKEFPKKSHPDIIEKDLIFVGLVGMMDPPREETIGSIKQARAAGIKVSMVTGDHLSTGLAIAKFVGLATAESKVMEGSQLESLSDKELEAVADTIAVYARVSPEHKVRIVQALQSRGYIVAMTGDGINDAPALRFADIGIAMGLKGTDVAKEASAMVLEDDNFATIVSAVKEGRIIYDNIKKFLRFLLSSNVGEVLTIFAASLLGLPLPLIAVQLLWMNLLTDGMPAVALSVDPADPDVMSRLPRKKDEPPIDKRMISTVVLVSVLMALGTLWIFNYLLERNASLEFAQSAAFTSLVLFQMFNVYSSRSQSVSAFRLGTNKWLHIAVLSSLLLQFAVLYVPQLQPLFGTEALDSRTLLMILGVASTGLLAVEVKKMIRK
jgi:Ca2+-transporting ATPase